jgi:hypothetical protein
MSSETPPTDLSAELSITRTAPATVVKDPAAELRKHLNGIRERLSTEFQPRVAADVVSREVDLAAAQFDGARVMTYVPVLVNRQVRLKLRQLVTTAA